MTVLEVGIETAILTDCYHFMGRACNYGFQETSIAQWNLQNTQSFHTYCLFEEVGSLNIVS